MSNLKTALIKGKRQEGQLPVMFCGKLTKNGLITKKVMVRGNEMDCGEGRISLWGKSCISDATYIAKTLGAEGQIASSNGAIYADIVSWGPSVKIIEKLSKSNAEIIGLGNIKAVVNDKGNIDFKISVSGVIDTWNDLPEGQHYWQSLRPILGYKGVPVVVAAKMTRYTVNERSKYFTTLLPKESTNITKVIEIVKKDLGDAEIASGDKYLWLNTSDFSHNQGLPQQGDYVGCGILNVYNGKISLSLSNTLMASEGVWSENPEKPVSSSNDSTEYTVA